MCVYMSVCVKVLVSLVQLFVNTWTVDPRLLCPWDFPDENNGVGCHFLLQGIFLTQGSNVGLLHGRHILYCLSHQGSPDRYFNIISFNPETNQQGIDQTLVL